MIWAGLVAAFAAGFIAGRAWAWTRATRVLREDLERRGRS